MSDDDDAKAVERVARQFIERNGGAEALRMLDELAKAAQGAGDQLSAKAWRDIANAARLLSELSRHR